MSGQTEEMNSLSRQGKAGITGLGIAAGIIVAWNPGIPDPTIAFKRVLI
jgi:hypothetical protein